MINRKQINEWTHKSRHENLDLQVQGRLGIQSLVSSTCSTSIHLRLNSTMNLIFRHRAS